MGMETAAAPSTNRRLASVAAHLRPEQGIVAAPSSAAELQWAPLSPSVPWGRLLTSSTPLVELAADERHASAMREQLLEHGVLCLRPVGDAADVLPEPADFVAIMAALNPAAEGTADAIERMKTFESTPADTNDDAEDPVALDCPKAHAEGFPNVRLLGDERDDSGRTKQLLCETGYEWHTVKSVTLFPTWSCSQNKRRSWPQDNVGPSHTALLCRSPLASGGETLFTSAARMYTELSEEQREKLHSLTAVHSNRFTAGGPSAFDCAHGLRMNATGTAVTRVSHTKRPSWTLSDAAGPLVERHSVTGVPYLVCVAKNLDQIEGMSVEESRATLHELMLPGLGGEPQVLGTIDEETGLTTSRTVFNPGVPRLLPLSLR